MRSLQAAPVKSEKLTAVELCKFDALEDTGWDHGIVKYITIQAKMAQKETEREKQASTFEGSDAFWKGDFYDLLKHTLSVPQSNV